MVTVSYLCLFLNKHPINQLSYFIYLPVVLIYSLCSHITRYFNCLSIIIGMFLQHKSLCCIVMSCRLKIKFILSYLNIMRLFSAHLDTLWHFNSNETLQNLKNWSIKKSCDRQKGVKISTN